MNNPFRSSGALLACALLLSSLTGTAAFAGEPNPNGYISPTLLHDAVRVTDYASLGLSAPPVGERWIRVGDEAMLVNARSGEVYRIAKGVFS